MSIEVWWPKIPRESRLWLMENNGDAVPEHIRQEIGRAGDEIVGSYLPD